ncbi:MAG: hypothetical protein ACM3UU_10060 [Ignavibacteriales bacterium]
MKRLKDIDLYNVYCKWRQGAGPFECFFRAANFTSLKYFDDFNLSQISLAKDKAFNEIEKAIKLHDTKKTLFMAEMNDVEGIKAAFILQNDYKLKPILTFNNPLHPFGLIGGTEYISSLLSLGEGLNPINPKGFVFILNQNRFGDYSDEDLKKFFNNQYELSDEDLPPYEMLCQFGFEKLVFMYKQEPIKEDTAGYIQYLKEKNFVVIQHKFGEE